MTETEDYQKPGAAAVHHTTHENGGSDEVSVAALSGQLADNQPSSWALLSGKPSTFSPDLHKTSHQDGGADEISVQGLSGTLADPQTPATHKTTHQDAGADEIDLTGLAGKVQLVDRGDPAAYDWTAATLIKDSTYRDLNCSAIVPAGAKFILFHVQLKHTALGKWFALRKKSYVNIINQQADQNQSTASPHHFYPIVPCDADRIISYYAESGITWVNIDIAVIGWIT